MKSEDIISALICALHEVHSQGSLAKETALKLLAVVIASIGDGLTSLVIPEVPKAEPNIVNDVARVNIDGATKAMKKQKYFYKVKAGCGRLYRTLKGAEKNHHKSCKAKGSGCSLETTMLGVKNYSYRSDIQGWLKNKDVPYVLRIATSYATLCPILLY